MQSRLSDLFDRRVPQWTAVYLGAGWGMVQFIAFIEERYLISPHWTDLCLLTLGLLLPSVVLYTYNHGRPGADRIQRSERVGIPANLALAAVVLWMVFGGKDLGAMTTEVTVTDADGDTIERALPKAEYRRRIALFTPETPAGADTAWAGEALTVGLVVDLAQDPWLETRYGLYFAEQLRERGFEPGQTIPLALKREIAREMNLTHLVTGTIQDADEGFRTTLRLYDVERGRLISEHSYAGRDLLALVDSASYALREDLELPQAHLDEVEDLPASERMTSRLDALRAYAFGGTALSRNDWATASQRYAEAVALDSTFAVAAADLFQARLLTGDHQGAMAALGIVANHIYRLPERLQFAIRAAQYQMQQQSERAIGVYEMAAQLYPDDITPRQGLAMIYPLANRTRDAIAVLEEILEIDPAQIEHLLTIGSHYRELGEDDSAFAAYRRYVEAAPERAEGPRALGDLHAARGEHDQAREQYERAAMLDGDNVDVLIAIATLERDVGNFPAARAQLDAALAGARNPESRFKVLEALAELHGWFGRPAAAYEVTGRAIQQAAQFTPPLVVAIFQLASLEALAEAGRVDDAERLLATVTPQFAGLYADVPALGALGIETGRADPDPARIDAAADRIERFIQSTGWEAVRPTVLEARGLAAEERGDLDAALRMYRQRLELDPTATAVHTDVGRVLRLRGELPAAARELELTLRRRPADPVARYELALVHAAAGRDADAVAELRRALAAWSDAEPGYAPAARARAELDRLLAARPAGG